jgi:hypothetical protein
VEFLKLTLAGTLVESACGHPFDNLKSLLVKPTEIANYRETDDEWLTGLLDRRQELSIQLAKLDVEIGIVRGALRAREAARAKNVSQDCESQ